MKTFDLNVSILVSSMIIGQIDKKFILLNHKCFNADDNNNKAIQNILFIIDQHAAHERILLEKYENYIANWLTNVVDKTIKQHNLKNNFIKISPINNPILYELINNSPQISIDYLSKHGFSIKIIQNQMQSKVYITKIPLILETNYNVLKTLIKHILYIIEQLLTNKLKKINNVTKIK